MCATLEDIYHDDIEWLASLLGRSESDAASSRPLNEDQVELLELEDLLQPSREQQAFFETSERPIPFAPSYAPVTGSESIGYSEVNEDAEDALPPAHQQELPFTAATTPPSPATLTTPPPSSTLRTSLKRYRQDGDEFVEGASTLLVMTADDREASAEASTSTRLDDVTKTTGQRRIRQRAINASRDSH